MIQILEQGQIDRKKWDSCISRSGARLIYGYSWYLDLVHPGWYGMISDNYSYVMPLPLKKNWGVTYALQPKLTQQLGVFSRNEISGESLKNFIDHIPADVKYLDLNINFSNRIDNTGFTFVPSNNYVLKLNHSHQEIEKRYTENIKRNIKKSVPFIEIFEEPQIPDFIRLKRENSNVKRSVDYFEWMNIFIEKLKLRGKGRIIGAGLNGKLVAAVFVAISDNRIYYLLPVSNADGKKHRAMFGLIDYIIGKYEKTGMIFDFEGSNIPGIARLFEGFGGRNVGYHKIRINRLPFYMKFFKK